MEAAVNEDEEALINGTVAVTAAYLEVALAKEPFVVERPDVAVVGFVEDFADMVAVDLQQEEKDVDQEVEEEPP